MAMEERGERLRMFDVSEKKAQTFAEITLELTNQEENSNNPGNAIDWITDGIKTENDQWVTNLISVWSSAYIS